MAEKSVLGLSLSKAARRHSQRLQGSLEMCACRGAKAGVQGNRSVRRSASLCLLLLVLAAAIAPPAAADEDCTAAGIAAARKAFQAAYDAKSYDEAQSIIDPLWRECIAGQPVGRELAASVASDFALVSHRTGDDEMCLGLLEDYAPARTRNNDAMAALPPRLQQAIRFNFRQCRAYCTDNPLHATCAGIRVDEQLDRLVVGDFREAPCPFDAGGSPSLALPGAGGAAACLALLPPLADPFSFDNAETADPAQVCPRAVIVGKVGDQVSSDAVALPQSSFLQNVRLCCGELRLAIDAGGRIEVTPSENPPEDCLSGHRTAVLQDLFVLRGAELVLTHRLSEAEE
jgi:hypothetical protein